jgi:hypothetical protein
LRTCRPEIAGFGHVHLKHTPGPTTVAADHHIGGRDDAVVWVDVGKVQARRGTQVGEDDGHLRGERLPAGIALVGPSEGAADYARLPAHARPDDEVALVGPVFEHLAEGYAQAFRTEPRPLGQHPIEVGPGERAAAELCQCLTLA